MAHPIFKLVRPGWLRDKITLQYPVAGAADVFGQPAVTWTNEVSPRAYVEDLSGREVWYGQAIQSELSRAIVIRSRDGGGRRRIQSTWRVLWGDVTMQVESVMVDPDGVWQVLLCKELVGVS